MATGRGWIQRLRNFVTGTTDTPALPAPIPVVAATQRAEVDGRNNIIIQIQGDGNSVIEHLPHLTLTRYLTRRQADENESEANLLTPYRMAIPLIGREQQLAELHAWLTSAKLIAVRVLVGRAGSGKTRLALELCEEAITQQWDSGFVTERELERFMAQQNLATWGWRRPTLIVIDYAASRAQQLHDWFVELADNGGAAHKPLRVLLLERQADPAGGWWQEAFGRGDSDAQAVRRLLDPVDHPVTLPGLADAEQRRTLLTAVLEQSGSTARPPARGVDAHFDRLLADLTWGGEPLFLFMAGLVAARQGFGYVLALSRTDLAYAIADREIERIEAFAKKHRLDPHFLSHMAAYVTLCQGLAQRTVEEVSEEEKAAEKRHSAGDPPLIAEALCAVLTNENGAVQPIQPDIIGEAVLLRILHAQPQEKQDAYTLRAFHHAGGRVAATVVRTAQDYAYEGDPAPLSWLDSLAREGAVRLAMLLEIADQLPLNTLVLRERAATIYGTIVEQARRWVDAASDSEAARSLLASSLNNLANHLSDLGQREAALTAAQEAVELRRQLAAARPDAFVPDLAMSLNNLANRLSDLGQREAALTAAQEAVELYRQLAAARPDAFVPNLASSLNNLANRLSDLGQREAALTAAQEAVELYRQLAAARPDAFVPNLASSLNNLANHLSDLGQREAALTAAQEAVELRRQLAAARPDAFVPDLASSLNNLATFLSDLGQREAALTAAQEAVTILSPFFLALPPAFAQWMVTMVQNYLRYAEQLQREPDAALLLPIIEKLNTLQSSSGGAA